MTVLSLVAAAAAVVAALAAVCQVRRLHTDALDARVAEIMGVTVAAVVVERPRPGEAADGRRRWVIDFTIHNPGRLPISDVRAVVEFVFEVQRQHSNGAVDHPTRRLEIGAPIILPNASHPARRRTLSIPAEHDATEGMKITVTFTTPDAGKCTNKWPIRPPGPRGGLARRLKTLSNPRRRSR